MGWTPHSSFIIPNSSFSVHPMTLLILLPAAARARVIPADLLGLADDLLHLRAFALHFISRGGGFCRHADIGRLAEVFCDAVVLRHLVLGFGDLVVATRLGRTSAQARVEDQ